MEASIHAANDGTSLQSGFARRVRSALHGVRARLVLLALASMVPVFALAAAVLFRFVQLEEDAIRSRGIELARLAAEEVEQEIAVARAMLVGLSTSHAMHDRDYEALYKQAVEAANRYGKPIGAIDSQGQRRFVTWLPYGQALPPHPRQDLVKQVLETGRGQVTDLMPATAIHTHAVVVLEPAMHDGSIIGLFGIEIDVARVVARIAASKLPDQWLVAILDRKGVIIARSRAAEQFVGTLATEDLRALIAKAPTGVSKALTKEGYPVFTAYTHAQLSGWTVAVGVPESVVHEPLNATLRELAVSTVVLTALAVGMALLVARGIGRPLVALAGAAGDLGQGRPVAAVATGLAEADRVARALHEAGVDLAKRARERDEAEMQLRGREAQLRSILDTIPDAMVILDAEGTIRSFSAMAEQMFGWSADEARGRNLRMLLPSRPGDQHDGALAHLVQRGAGLPAPAAMVATKVVDAVRRDGTLFSAEFSIGRIDAAGETLFTGFIRDLTERLATERRIQDLQAELMHATRLSAMGQVVSTIAHELNQPLAAVSNYLEVARLLSDQNECDRNGCGQGVADALVRALEQAERASETFRRVRNFAANRTVDFRVEPVPAIVEDACALGLIGFRGTPIRLHQEVEAGCPPVLADRVQVQQVLVNLIRNAAEAMAHGPRRDLTVSAVHRADAGVVEFAVADTGSGLSAEITGQLFAPFQTTKAEGMGIGLSVARTIVEAHGGRIWADANPGGGSLFRFTVPAADLDDHDHLALQELRP